MHPDDKPFLDAGLSRCVESNRRKGLKTASFKPETYQPCPFDGPLDQAKVVVCLANPNYQNLDAANVNQIVNQQRNGRAALPPEWDRYYQPRIADPMGVSMDEIRSLVSVLNICPYASASMGEPEIRLAAGLPSVWAAQKHLRELLIPLARRATIFLVIVRKHQLWGITEGFQSTNIAVARGRERGGTISKELGREIRRWLQDSGALLASA